MHKEREFGIYNKGLYNSKSPEYILWDSMIRRCHNQVTQKHSPSYVGCTVSEEFYDFQYFALWCQRQKGFSIPTRQLDKDLLKKWNKCYSEDTCVFLPREINNLFIRRDAGRGDYEDCWFLFMDS